ncbi:MAG TPA: tRNA pseudouridine(55) synthase TruB [Acidobacteriota bacterium]|nr:tRNA pseudouridine(55) synthase TruB [Acidobacteriota bacterium]
MGRRRKYERSDINGVLVINKPAGPTSHDMVALVRRCLKAKAGHAGTLDPQASGVLVLVLGQATRLARYLQGHDKQYRAVIRLGRATDTYDAEGRVTDEHSVPELSRQQVEEVLQAFRGPIQQRTPLYSAVKVKGKKLYEYARKGQQAERPLRSVTISRLQLLEREDSAWTLLIDCTSGTYVRSLAHDMGRRLGCGAHLESLVRTRSGPFQIAQAIAPQEVEARWQEVLVPMEKMLPELPRIDVDPSAAKRVLNGAALMIPDPARGQCRLFCQGRLLAIAASDGLSVQPKIVFQQS